VYEEVQEAKNRAFYVGQHLGLHVADVESICTQEKEARDQLYKVLLQTAREAKLTWEKVAIALRKPLVGLPLVARRIEETHCRGSSIPTLPPTRPRTAPEQPTEPQRATQLGEMSARRQRCSRSAYQRKSLELSHPPNIMVVQSSCPPYGRTSRSYSASTSPPITPPYSHTNSTHTHVAESMDLQACLTVNRSVPHSRQIPRPHSLSQLQMPTLQSVTPRGMATDI
jgi:hypothetical protein